MSRFSAMLGPAAKTEWGTPRWLFDAIAKRYGPFDLDVCATVNNAKCPLFYTPEQDGLVQPWGGVRCWMNPPYGRGHLEAWLAKAIAETGQGAHVTSLIPVRPGAEWWRTFVANAAQVIEYLPQRIRFDGAPHNAPFDSAVVCWFSPIARPKAVEVAA